MNRMRKKSITAAIVFLIISLVMVFTACETKIYSIKVEDSENGIVSTSVNNAKEGDSITVFVLPNAGYKLKSESLTFNNNPIVGNVFSMPGSDVSINAEFEKIVFSVNVLDTQNGSLAVDKVIAAPGETVTVTVTPISGYRMKPFTLKMNGTKISGLTFVMPSKNVSLFAEFEVMPVGMHSITINEKLENGRIVTALQEAVAGETVMVSVAANSGYSLEKDSLNFNGINIEGYSFIMPDADVVISAQFVKLYKISVSSQMVNGTLKTKSVAVAGEEITITVKSFGKYQLDESTLYYNETNKIKGRTFIMPEADVVLQCDFIVFKTYKRINETGEEDEKGKYILFGMYPATIKPGDVTVVEDNLGEDGYYTANTGDKYAKIKGNPFDINYKFSTSASIIKDSEYFFKLEPIKWKIVAEDNGKLSLVCDTIIDSGSFLKNDNVSIESPHYNIKEGVPSGIYSNNWEYSDVRMWLNETFYKTAFSSEHQAPMITTANLNNSTTAENGESTDNKNIYSNVSDTLDKVFLLSYKDSLSAKYGYESSAMTSDSARRKLTTDYSRARGTVIDQDEFNGNGTWMLRTAASQSSNLVSAIYSSGVVNSKVVDAESFGIVPCVIINI